MKRIVMAIITLCLLLSSTLAFAAKPNTCVLLVASPDMKSEDVIKMIGDIFKSSPETTCGSEIQTKYQEYWFTKGYMKEGELTPQIMTEFRDYCGYDRCLFVVEESNTESNIVTYPDYIRGTSYSEMVTTATVNLTCYLVGKDAKGKTVLHKILNSTGSARSGQGAVKAKKWAIKEAVQGVYKQFKAL